MMIVGFILAHICLAMIILGFIMPRYYDALVPPHRQSEGTEATCANETKGEIVARADGHDYEVDGGETGLAYSLSRGQEELGTK